MVFAQSAADLVEHFGRRARGMQGLALTAAEGLLAEHGLDPVGLRLIGDCGEAHHLPLLLLEHVAGEIILVQPV